MKSPANHRAQSRIILPIFLSFHALPRDVFGPTKTPVCTGIPRTITRSRLLPKRYCTINNKWPSIRISFHHGVPTVCGDANRDDTTRGDGPRGVATKHRSSPFRHFPISSGRGRRLQAPPDLSPFRGQEAEAYSPCVSSATREQQYKGSSNSSAPSRTQRNTKGTSKLPSGISSSMVIPRSSSNQVEILTGKKERRSPTTN